MLLSYFAFTNINSNYVLFINCKKSSSFLQFKLIAKQANLQLIIKFAKISFLF
jgi:hypothetical protein